MNKRSPILKFKKSPSEIEFRNEYPPLIPCDDIPSLNQDFKEGILIKKFEKLLNGEKDKILLKSIILEYIQKYNPKSIELDGLIETGKYGKIYYKMVKDF